MLEFLKIDLSNNIAIFLILIMFFFSLYLIVRVNELKREIDDLKFDDKFIFQKKAEVIEEDIISISDISSEVLDDDEKRLDKNVDDKVVAVLDMENVGSIRKKKNKQSDEFYDVKQEVKKKEVRKSEIEKTSFRVDEFVKEKNDFSNSVSGDDYLREVSKKMASELAPQTIELTDYEKDQEENAIISYQELLAVRESSSLDDGDDIDFIDELKKLRNSLNIK